MNRIVRKALRACRLYDAAVDLKKWLTGAEAKYVKFYSQFVKSGELVFDVGANVGRRTGVFLKLGAKVIAIEPQDHCMARLMKKYGNNERVTLVRKAVGATRGQAEMLLCDSHSLSSLSKRWIETVQASGRYSACTWNRTVAVPVVTLDDLILEYGKPAFMKIDVEGYEYEVLKGLSEPAGTICFEFTPELMETALDCIGYLSQIGPAEFNYCLEDLPATFASSEWRRAGQFRESLAPLREAGTVGDIYARFGD